MLAAPQARAAIGHFFDQWTGSQRLDITTKSTTLFPSFSPELRSAMAAELPAFIEHVLWSGDHSLRALLTEPVAFVNAPLADLYGLPAPSGSGLVQVDLPPAQGRAGLLTQAGFLSVQGAPGIKPRPCCAGNSCARMLLWPAAATATAGRGHHAAATWSGCDGAGSSRRAFGGRFQLQRLPFADGSDRPGFRDLRRRRPVIATTRTATPSTCPVRSTAPATRL